MENEMNDYKIGTKCVQAGYTPENGQPRQIPIIQSTTFKYSTSEDMGKLFDLEASGYFYTRLQNPTNDHVAAKIAASYLHRDFCKTKNPCHHPDKYVPMLTLYARHHLSVNLMHQSRLP